MGGQETGVVVGGWRRLVHRVGGAERGRWWFLGGKQSKFFVHSKEMDEFYCL